MRLKTEELLKIGADAEDGARRHLNLTIVPERVSALITEVLELREALTTIENKANAVLSEHDPGDAIPSGPEAVLKTGEFARAAARALDAVATRARKALQETP